MKIIYLFLKILFNPLSDTKELREQIIKILSTLRVLDCKAISIEEREPYQTEEQ